MGSLDAQGDICKAMSVLCAFAGGKILLVFEEALLC